MGPADPADRAGDALGDLGRGLVVLVLLGLAAVLAPWLSGATPGLQFDPVDGTNLAPVSRRFEIVTRAGTRMLAETVDARDGGLRITNPSGSRFLPLADIEPGIGGELARPRIFLLGTDRFGRDLWTRLVYGARVSLTVAILAAALSSLLGILIGSTAAMGGRTVDGLIMRTTDAFMAFPRLFLLLALTAIISSSPAMVVLVLGLTSWMPVSRLVRAELLRLKTTDMALAARASGSGTLRIVSRHLLPNALVPITIATALRVGDVLLLEAALSFLGLGIRPPMPSWGNMVADGAPDIATAWWTSALPGLAIVVTVIAINLVGDGLQQRWRKKDIVAGNA